MTETERKRLSGQALKVYDRMLERVQSRLANAEKTTLEGVRAEIANAVEMENELEEMTREEVDLLAAYLRRDLENLMHFVDETGDSLTEWLQLDLSLLEQQLTDALFSIADKTRLDTLELNQKLDNEDVSRYIAGEVATAGMFRCLNCHHMTCLTATSHIEVCEACGSHYFERVTGRWPPDAE
ncbi:zinc ribbon-containing protein [Marinobacter sp. X15-166B]|uniref:zinc ribbon-containing protein n=1 Tax=Marinobacter sp. X15-166B TaxID=1897620 RepID=UPI00085C7433|nr:zinc ribbon-containing protein [Marinobacter sp. X15-166B]OEY65225.1 metalloendopeptidase [Marinobacter sp. X15-166B]